MIKKIKHFLSTKFPALAKSKNKQLLIIILLVLLLPLTVFLATNKTIRTFLLRTKGAANSRMYLLPEGVSQTPAGKWVFNKDQEVTMDIMLDSADNQIEGAEGIVNYDPAVISVTRVECNQSYLLKNALVQSIAKNTDGTEAGKVDVACTAVPLPPYPDPNTLPVYQPMPAQTQATFAKIYFKALAATTASSAFTFQFAAGNPDLSNAVLYQGSGTNVLGSVTNFPFDVTLPAGGASLILVPSTGTYEVNKPFSVQVILNSGQYNVDSVDAVIDYDKTNLRADLVTEGNTFPVYTKVPSSTGIDATNGVIQVSGRVDTALPQPVYGNNLLFATLTFTPLNAVNNANAGYIRFRFTIGDRNDSNVVSVGNDVLASVTNGLYILTTLPQPTATPTITGQPTPIVTSAPTSTPTRTPTPIPPTPTSTRTPTPTQFPTGIPTFTPVPPTPTSVPSTVRLNIILALQGRDWTGTNLIRDVRFRITTPTIDQNITGQSFKNLSLTNLPLALGNTYDLLVKPLGYLQKKFSVAVNSTVIDLDFSSTVILAGDLDGSGKINSLDYTIWLNNFKTSDNLSDLDGSGQVNSIDFSLMLSNWNAVDET